MLKYVKTGGSIKSPNVITPDDILSKKTIPNLCEVKSSLSNKPDKISIKTKVKLPGNECNLLKLVSQTNFNVASSDGTVDGVDFIEKVTYSLEYTGVEASFSEVVVEEDSDDEEIPPLFLEEEEEDSDDEDIPTLRERVLDEEESYSGEEVEEFSEEENDLDSDIYDDADHDNDSDYSDTISVHFTREDVTEHYDNRDETSNCIVEDTYCENCF